MAEICVKITVDDKFKLYVTPGSIETKLNTWFVDEQITVQLMNLVESTNSIALGTGAHATKPNELAVGFEDGRKFNRVLDNELMEALQEGLKALDRDSLSASEALYGFMGWLTTRDEVTLLHSQSNASKAAELVTEFCEANGLKEPRGGWSQDLVHPERRTTAVSKARYEELLGAENWLSCLNAVGVDNWGGISEACTMYEEEYNNG